MAHPGNIWYNFYDSTGAVKSREQALEAAGFKHVASLDEGGGYDWAVADVFRVLASGRLVWTSDSGCSCYGPYDNSLDDPIEIDDYRSFRDQVSKTSAFMSYASVEAQRSFLRKVQRALRS